MLPAPMPAPQPWLLLVTPPAPGAFNMALDELLMERAVVLDRWILRVYAWSAPTVSFGRHQTARGAYDPERIRQRGFGVVRRPTGGRAILHDREITYSVTAPLVLAGDLRRSYEAINHILVESLRRLGVGATVAEDATRSASPGVVPCFDHPSAGELVIADRKLAGSAQWRSSDALLQHGSILVDDDQGVLDELLADGRSRRPPPAATLREALGHAPSLGEFADAAESVIAEGAPVERWHFDAGGSDELPALVARYATDGWTWRR
jgi:lipoate-protein ligase A